MLEMWETTERTAASCFLVPNHFDTYSQARHQESGVKSLTLPISSGVL